MLRTYLTENERSHAWLARKLNIKPVNVTLWVNNKRPCPILRCIEIERLTKGEVRCEDLRPDVDWATLRGKRTTRKTKKESTS